MQDLRDELTRITTELLQGTSLGSLHTACNDLYLLFSGITGISEGSDNEADPHQTILSHGKALSPRDAARCVVDFARTVAFLRGVNAAIGELKKRFPGEQVEVLYAGCGPFAPLIVPLLDGYSAADLRVTLLDIHQRSLDAAEIIVRDFGFESFVDGFVRADASEYQHPTHPHLIICEMLQQALKTEPQVAVTANLAPQLINGGVFIPEQITVEGCLADPNKEIGLEGTEPVRIPLGRLIDLDAKSIRTGQPTSLTPVAVEIPAIEVDRFQLLLLTRVRVFASILLDARDAGITCPTPLNIQPSLKPGDRIEFTYVSGSNPHFEYVLTRASGS